MRNFMLDASDVALVIVDIQERLAAVMSKREGVVNNTLHLIECAKLLGVPVIVTEQYPRGLGTTLDEIKVAVPEYKPFEKVYFGCCEEPGFNQLIGALGRRTMLVAGMESHVCVLQTALGMLKEGYGVQLVADAVCSRKKSDHLTGLGVARDAGAVVTSTEAALFQMLRRAGTDEFKVISKRIK